jgi:hypothetical protein
VENLQKVHLLSAFVIHFSFFAGTGLNPGHCIAHARQVLYHRATSPVYSQLKCTLRIPESYCFNPDDCDWFVLALFWNV